MTYCLDTNIVSYAIKDNFDIREKINAQITQGNIIVLSSISYYETFRGLLKIAAEQKIRTFNAISKVLTYQDLVRDDWYAASELYAHCMNSGHPMADNDLFQAAFCLRNNCTLVTHNVKHFEHISGLAIEDWTEAGYIK